MGGQLGGGPPTSFIAHPDREEWDEEKEINTPALQEYYLFMVSFCVYSGYLQRYLQFGWATWTKKGRAAHQWSDMIARLYP